MKWLAALKSFFCDHTFQKTSIRLSPHEYVERCIKCGEERIIKTQFPAYSRISK